MVDGKHVSKIQWGLVEGKEEKLWQCHNVMVLVFKKEDATKTFAIPCTCLARLEENKGHAIYCCMTNFNNDLQVADIRGRYTVA
jgi:hypothetical protein